MYEKSTEELAINKLYILYILFKMNIPLTNAQITTIFMENEILDYFSLQQYFHELTEAQLIDVFDEETAHQYLISEKGRLSLDYFKNRLSYDVMDKIDSYVEENRDLLLRQREINASVTKLPQGEYEVRLQIADGETPYMDLRFKVPTNKTAQLICDNWNNHSTDIYTTIAEILIGSKNNKNP